MIAVAPVQTPVIVSPSSQLRMTLAAQLSPSEKPATQRLTHAGHMASNGHVSTPQSSSPKPLTNNNPLTPQLATIPSLTLEEHVALMSSDFRGSDLEPPVIGPKSRDHIRNNVGAAFKEGDDDVYNLPRQDLYRPRLIDYYQQDEETYDTPSRFKQPRAVNSYGDDDDDDNDDADDNYDLPPTMYRHEAKVLNTDDDVYDIPPMKVSTNVTSDCQPPAHHVIASHHIYTNVDNSVSVHTTGPTFGNVKPTDKLIAEPNSSDPSEDFEVVESPRTRSFKSSNNWYVFHFELVECDLIS